jgi:hypothetical protein
MRRRVGIIVLAAGMLAACVSGDKARSESRREGTTTSSPATTHIPYTVVEARPIPGGRQAQVIVIDSAYRTDAALRQLGSELHRDHPRDFILVYTDSMSATRRDRGDVDRLPPAQQRQYDRSLVASTTLMPGTWLFSVDGIRQDPDTTLTTITFPP